MTLDDIDSSCLIREAYRMEGIGPSECRSIFLDWAIRLPVEFVPREAIGVLLDAYGTDEPDHPMSAVLRAGLKEALHSGRRGGRRARMAKS